jgi:hypothetical protein
MKTVYWQNIYNWYYVDLIRIVKLNTSKFDGHCILLIFKYNCLSFNFLSNTLFYWLKNWDDFVSPKKNLSVTYICSNVTEYSSAIKYSAKTSHGTYKVLLHNIHVFRPPPWNGRGHIVLPFVIPSFHKLVSVHYLLNGCTHLFQICYMDTS